MSQSIPRVPTSANRFPSKRDKGSGTIICDDVNAASNRTGNCQTRTRNRVSSWRMGSVNESTTGDGDGTASRTRSRARLG